MGSDQRVFNHPYGDCEVLGGNCAEIRFYASTDGVDDNAGFGRTAVTVDAFDYRDVRALAVALDNLADVMEPTDN